MAESGSTMAFHSIIIGFIMYAIMTFMGVEQDKAENRSVLLAGVVAVYMVLFGHGPPCMSNLNERLF
jgi:hypothetical protein